MSDQPDTQKSLIIDYLKEQFADRITDVKSVTRKIHNIKKLRRDQVPALSITNGPEKRKRISLNQNMFEAEMLLDILVYAFDQDEPQEALDYLVQEVTMAVAEDHTMDGNAIRSEIVEVVPDRGIYDPFALAVIRLKVWRRFNELTQGG